MLTLNELYQDTEIHSLASAKYIPQPLAGTFSLVLFCHFLFQQAPSQAQSPKTRTSKCVYLRAATNLQAPSPPSNCCFSTSCHVKYPLSPIRSYTPRRCPSEQGRPWHGLYTWARECAFDISIGHNMLVMDLQDAVPAVLKGDLNDIWSTVVSPTLHCKLFFHLLICFGRNRSIWQLVLTSYLTSSNSH